VESPAAFALRRFVSRPEGARSAIPGEVGRYLAWAAARSLSMRQLYQAWVNDLPLDPTDAAVGELPPPGFEQMAPITRFHRMEHPVLGIRDSVPSDEVELLRHEGEDFFSRLTTFWNWFTCGPGTFRRGSSRDSVGSF
jgi:hypothetical protein